MADPQATRPTREQYLDWLRASGVFDISARHRAHHDVVARALVEQVRQSVFWSRLTTQLDELDHSFMAEAGSFLLAGREREVVSKPFDSMIDKSYRKNVVQNARWDDPPDGGWVTPSNWLERLNDPVRTMFVTRYVDGCSWLATRIEELALAIELPCHVDYEAREEGYYAVHTYVGLELPVPALTWDMVTVRCSFEIQIATQVQEVIRPLTHPFYVERRSKIEPRPKKWQWDISSDEFGANFLAHSLHHIEGLIVSVRDRRRKTHGAA